MVIWSAPAKRAFFYVDPEIAAKKAVELSEKKENVYVGMGLQNMPKRRRTRGKAKDVQAITCFWADLDFGKKGAPPDKKGARFLASEIGREPSIVVHSGHGLQCFWKFNQTLIFADDHEREDAADRTVGWIDTLQQLANAYNWHIDPVGDLSRVMRVPGTTNWKNPEEPLPVKILEPAHESSDV